MEKSSYQRIIVPEGEDPKLWYKIFNKQNKFGTYYKSPKGWEFLLVNGQPYGTPTTTPTPNQWDDNPQNLPTELPEKKPDNWLKLFEQQNIQPKKVELPE